LSIISIFESLTSVLTLVSLALLYKKRVTLA